MTSPSEPTVEASADWTTLDPVALSQHIAATHHAFLREELPLLDELAATVSHAHRKAHPELVDVRRLVAALTDDVLPHLTKEERLLFPSIAAVCTGADAVSTERFTATLRTLETDHERTASLLRVIRSATHGYAVPDDASPDHGSLYERLAAVEADLVLHMHKEDDVLFPAVARLIAD